MIERSRVRIRAGAAGEFSPGQLSVLTLILVSVTPPCYFYMVGSYPVFTRLALSWLFHGLPCILIIWLKFVSFYYHTNHHWGVSSFSLMLLYFCHAPFHSTQTRHQDGIFVLENAELLFSSTCMVKHSIRTVNHRGNCASQVVYSIPHWDKCSIDKW